MLTNTADPRILSQELNVFQELTPSSHPPPPPLPSELRVWASSLASDLVFTVLSGCTKRLMGGTGRWLSGQSTCHTHIST